MKLIKDSLAMLVSIAVPAVIAIPAFAFIAQQVGLELFGIYTLSFAIIGYASIFDLGIARAVIREIAINRDNKSQILVIINTAFAIMLGLGVLAGLVIVSFRWFLLDVIDVSVTYYDDVNVGLGWLSLCVPTLLISQVFLAYFEGLAKFGLLSVVRTITNTLMIIFPCIATLLSPTFTALMVGMVFARFITLMISIVWIIRVLPVRPILDKITARCLLRFGGWLTVSAVVGPIMVYFDRFILSSVMGAKNVAFYTGPSEITIRLLALPSVAARTLFTRFSGKHGQEQKIYHLSILISGVVASLLVVPLWLGAEFVLVQWLGQAFGGEPVWVFRILLIGFVFNTIAQVPFNRLQAKGFSKQIAIMHCLEIAPYILLLFFFVKYYGLIGVAVAWTVRVAVDMLILFLLNLNYERLRYGC